MKNHLSLVAVALLAVGCGSAGPSNDEALWALQAQNRQIEAMGFPMTDDIRSMLPDIRSVDVKNCVKDGNNPKIAHCDVAVEGSFMGQSSDGSHYEPASFIETESEWIVLE